MEKKFDEETMLKIRDLLHDFVGDAPSDEEIEDMFDDYDKAADIMEVYAEAANLWQAIENAGY